MNRNRYSRRRHILAILLLMVMMLQMGAKTFHRHHHGARVEYTCSDCEHHKVHDGHIMAWDGESDDCPLCQILQSPYTIAEELPQVCVVMTHHSYDIAVVPDVYGATWCHISPRGPPYLFSHI